jgi:hypothetical protein
MDTDGKAWKEDALVDNVSAGGLYLKIHHALPKDSTISIAVRLSITPPRKFSVLRLGARGVVLRTDPQDDGTYGVALEFSRRRVF